MKPKLMLAFIAGIAATVGVLAAVTLSANLQVAEAQSTRSPTKALRHLDVYYPGTEDLGPDEMRVVALGTGMPSARPKQAAACWLVELGNGDKFLFDIGSGCHERLAAQIGAGHDQDQILGLLEPIHAGGPTCGFVEDQVMKRCVGQHDAERRKAGRDRRRKLGRLGAQNDDRPARRGQKLGFRIMAMSQRARADEIGRHDREGFLFTVLQLPQSRNCGLIARIARQMEPAKPFDCRDLAGLQAAQDLVDRRVQARPANGAGRGLRVESAI